MRTSHTLFLLELGISLQPLQASYNRYNFLATHSWMKMLWEKVSKFGVKVAIANTGVAFQREGDRFIMQEFFEQGYPRDVLRRLNRVRIYYQTIFLSDIFTASGQKLDPEVTRQDNRQQNRSKLRWPLEHPSESDFQLWKDAVGTLCPSRNKRSGLGPFLAPSHRIWKWRLDEGSGCLCRSSNDGGAEDVFRPAKKPNRFYYTETRAYTGGGILCSAEPTHAGADGGGWRLTSVATEATPPKAPQTFMEMLRSWGNTWLWDNVMMVGGSDWLPEAIQDGTLTAVTDGSYIRELYPDLCLAAFVFECKKERGRLLGSFLESLRVANAYRGELLGLMAIHLILLSVNQLKGSIHGSVVIVSDCLGALQRVVDLPPYRISSRCKHSDILKNILVNCCRLSFTTHYRHVRAHQDDTKAYENLGRMAQLNCICDHTAKQWIATDGLGHCKPGSLFPLEPIGMFVQGEKLTSDTGNLLGFWAHRQLA